MAEGVSKSKETLTDVSYDYLLLWFKSFCTAGVQLWWRTEEASSGISAHTSPQPNRARNTGNRARNTLYRFHLCSRSPPLLLAFSLTPQASHTARLMFWRQRNIDSSVLFISLSLSLSLDLDLAFFNSSLNRKTFILKLPKIVSCAYVYCVHPGHFSTFTQNILSFSHNGMGKSFPSIWRLFFFSMLRKCLFM